MSWRAYSSGSRHGPFNKGFPSPYIQPTSVVAAPIAPAALPGAPYDHFDFTDNSTVFNENTGTIQAGQGDTIVRVNNKGSHSQNLIDNSGTRATYDLAQINGLNVALCTGLGVLSSNMILGLSGTGYSFACVAQHTGVSTQQAAIQWEVNRTIQQDELGSGNWEASVNSGPTVLDTGVAVTDGVWVGTVFSFDNSILFAARASGGALVTATPASFFNPAAFEDFRVGLFDGQIAEVIVWDTRLSSAELLEVLAHFDGKYGVLPF